MQPGGTASRVLRILDARHFVPVVVAVGLLLRLAMLAYLADAPLQADSLSYHVMGVDLLQGNSFVPFYPPGVPYVLSVVYRLTGPGELAARATSLLWFFAMMAVSYHLARLVGGRRAARMTIFALAVYPTFVWHCTEPLTQVPTGVFLLLISSLLIAVLRKPRWRTLVLLGLTLGISVITRPSSLLLAVAVPAALLIVHRRPRVALVPFVLCAAIVGAWLVKAENMTGRFVFINDANAKNLFYGNNPFTPLYRTWWFGSHFAGDEGVPVEYTQLLRDIERLPPEERNRRFRQDALEHIRSRPDLFVLRTLNRIRTYFAFDTSAGSVLRSLYGAPTLATLAVVGLDALCYCIIMIAGILFVFVRWRSSTAPDAGSVLLFVALCYSLPYWFSFSHPTYHLPIMPLMAVLGAAYLETLATTPLKDAIRTSPRRMRWLIATLIIFVLIQIEWIVQGVGRI